MKRKEGRERGQQGVREWSGKKSRPRRKKGRKKVAGRKTSK